MKKFLLVFAFCAITVSSFANNEVAITKSEDAAKKLNNEF